MNWPDSSQAEVYNKMRWITPAWNVAKEITDKHLHPSFYNQQQTDVGVVIEETECDVVGLTTRDISAEPCQINWSEYCIVLDESCTKHSVYDLCSC